MNAQTHAPAGPQKKAGQGWKYAPWIILGAASVGWYVMVRAALDDPGFALEENYYQKASNWDETSQLLRASEELGHRLLPLQFQRVGSEARLQVQLTDAKGQPLTGRELQVQAFPNARAQDIQEVRLQEVGEGIYAGQLARPRLGLWELRWSAAQGEERWVQVTRLSLSDSDAAPQLEPPQGGKRHE